MSKITPCLWYKNEAEEAAKFYVSLMPDSRIDHVQLGLIDNPGGGKEGEVLVVEFTFAGQRFIALNGGIPQDHNYAVSFYVECRDQAEIDHLWEKLGEGGSHIECGWLKDRWGVHWQIVPRGIFQMLADPDRAKATRVMKAVLTMKKLDIAALERAYAGG